MHWQRWRTHGDPNYERVFVPKKCKEDNCETTQVSRGWCMHHYDAWRLHGDPQHHAKQPPKATICTVEGCGSDVYSVGWCEPHYRRNLRYGDPEYVPPKPKPKTCEIDDCSDYAVGRGWCEFHYRRWRKFGNPLGRELAECRTCGQPFMTDRKQTVNCSKLCTDEDRRHNRFGHRARRGRLREAFVEHVNRIRVYERDGWVCGICDEPVDRTLAWPDPRSPSLDHVIPLAKGGEHSYANTQLAHLRCNTQKGDRQAA